MKRSSEHIGEVCAAQVFFSHQGIAAQHWRELHLSGLQ